MNTVRDPQVAGMFYDSSPHKLRNQIQSFFAEVETIKLDNVGGIIAPHAGYMYSGRVAAQAYKTIINKDYETVIVVSPSHREYFHGVSIFNGDAYKTPLGEVPVNLNLKEKFLNNSNIIFEGIEGHRAEHALEVQLPFLQLVLNEFKLLPLVIGNQTREIIYELADTLSEIINEKTLLVASSDLSHFYSKKHAFLLDSRVVEHINNFDFEQLQTELETKKCEACGGGGIVALMKSLKQKGFTKTKVIAHTDSGDITGDDSEVVGYLSAAIYR